MSKHFGMIALVASLVELQGIGGQRIFVNPDLVINIREPHGANSGHFPPGTRCMVFTSDGKYISTIESCDSIRKKLEATGRTSFSEVRQ